MFRQNKPLICCSGNCGLLFSSNSTRKYINSILKTLKHFPFELIEEGFEELLNDKKWSYRMKTKFKEIVEFAEHENWDLN